MTRLVATFTLMLVISISACADRGSESASAPDTVPTSRVTPTDSASTMNAELDRGARRILRFLQGEAPFDSIRLADTVELRLAPEGGGARARIARSALREPAAWAVTANKHRYSFAPPASSRNVTTAVGRHLNCREYALDSRAPDLARFPHVGVTVRPAGGSSCLQTWNTTFVFDSAAGAPRLRAAVYDQWEW